MGTPLLQNCEPIESKLRKQIQGCWRELLKECKEKDIDKQGSVTATEFLGPSDSTPGETSISPASPAGGGGGGMGEMGGACGGVRVR